MKLKVFTVAPLSHVPTAVVEHVTGLKNQVAAYQHLEALVRSLARVEKGNHLEFVPVEVVVSG